MTDVLFCPGTSKSRFMMMLYSNHRVNENELTNSNMMMTAVKQVVFIRFLRKGLSRDDDIEKLREATRLCSQELESICVSWH